MDHTITLCTSEGALGQRTHRKRFQQVPVKNGCYRDPESHAVPQMKQWHALEWINSAEPQLELAPRAPSRFKAQQRGGSGFTAPLRLALRSHSLGAG